MKYSQKRSKSAGATQSVDMSHMKPEILRMIKRYTDKPQRFEETLENNELAQCILEETLRVQDATVEMLCFFSDRMHDLSKIVKTVQRKEERTHGPSNPVSRGVAELRKLGLKDQMEYLGCALRMHQL